MNTFTQWLKQLQFDNLLELVIIALASLICITVHESCHGLAAYWLGDDTAKKQGRISLNPLRHIDVAGLIMMVVARFGWAKPVPVDMRKFQNPKIGMAITALAGPVSNVLLMMVSGFIRVILIAFFSVRQSEVLWYLILFFEYITLLSAGLAVFNILPVPPLDGSKVLFSVLPDRAYEKLMRIERYGTIILVVLLFTNILDTPLLFLRNGLLHFVEIITVPVYETVIEMIMR